MTFSHSGSPLNSQALGVLLGPTQPWVSLGPSAPSPLDQVLSSPGPQSWAVLCWLSDTPHSTQPEKSRHGTTSELGQSHGRSHWLLRGSHTHALEHTSFFTQAPGLSHLCRGIHTSPQITLQPAATQVTQSQETTAKTSPYTDVVSHIVTKAYTHMHACTRTWQPPPKLHYA